jgi:hypothetical protein
MASDRQIEMVAVADLKRYARNARTHSPKQIEQLAASIREFGWTNPILADERLEIIAGHGRLEAAISLGEDRVPVIRITGLTDTQRRALIVADNKLALNAGWDEDLLKMELGDLLGEGFEATLTGFSQEELAAMFAPMTGDKPERAPKGEAPVSRPGDVWMLGGSRFEVAEPDEDMSFVKKIGKKRVVMTVPVGLDADAAVEAWEAFTGRSATLEGDGRTFAEVADARRQEIVRRR